MRKTFTKILISLVLIGIFVAPLGNNFALNRASAQTGPIFPGTSDGTGIILPSAPKAEPKEESYSLECSLLSSDLSLKTAIAIGIGGPIFGSLFSSGEGPGLGGCLAQFFFYLWEASNWIARGAGGFFDFFVFYSINDSSFRNDFVEKGWGLVRDIANIFFIIALLYVAMKTILNLSVSDNKKIVGTIIIVALLINFSLFVTKVVIDASNIIAKIFYTSMAPIDKAGKTVQEAGGERSISVALVRKFNPQQAVTQGVYLGPGGISKFIFVTIILLAVNLYLVYVFLSVAFLFLARVIGLWMSMIFSPLAFASHTVSFSIPGFGHKDWWPELFKSAFMAPIFVFFLYMIAMFTSLGLDIKYSDSDTFLQVLMSMVIPYAITMALLMSAKKIAVDFSGKWGAAVMTAVKTIGGVAGGVALGATAIAGRQIFGRLGSAIANNSNIKAWAAKSKVGSGFQMLGQKMGKGSFDMRQVKVAGKSLGGLTGMNMGEGKKGGFEQARADRVKRRQQRAEELKVGEDEPLTQALHQEEAALQGQLDVSHGALEDIEKQLKGAVEASSAARAARQEDPLNPQKIAAALAATQKVNDLREIKSAIKKSNGRGAGNAIIAAVAARGGASATLAGQFANHVNNAEVAALQNGRRSIDHMEDVVIRDAKNAIHHETRARMNNFAKRNESPMSNIFTVMSGGSWKGNREASHKIRMDVKLDSSGKNSGH